MAKCLSFVLRYKTPESIALSSSHKTHSYILCSFPFPTAASITSAASILGVGLGL